MADGIAALCRDLATLHTALCAATTPGRRDDRSTVSRIVAATLVATPRHDGSNIRKVPASRPAADLDLVGCGMELVADTLGCARQIRRAFGHKTREWTFDESLTSIVRFYPGLPDGDPLAGTVWQTLDGHRRRATQTLGLGRRWHVVGDCPVVREPYPAAWDGTGTEPTLWWDDGVCRSYDLAGSSMADSWVRSRLRVDADADRDSRAGDIRCFGCGSRWPAEDWLRLGTMMAAAG